MRLLLITAIAPGGGSLEGAGGPGAPATPGPAAPAVRPAVALAGGGAVRTAARGAGPGRGRGLAVLGSDMSVPAMTRAVVAQRTAAQRFELVADGLSFPTSLTFDPQGTAYVAESGLAFGGARADGR